MNSTRTRPIQSPAATPIQWRAWSAVLTLTIAAILLPSSRVARGAAFQFGDLFYAANQSGSRIYDITAGGNFTGATQFANGGFAGNANLGQMAWTADLMTMYTTNYTGNTVFAVDANGNSSLYATIASPLGIVVTDTGRVLVNSYGSGIYDITNPMSPTLFATLTGVARNMRQLPTGEILVAGMNGKVWDVSSGTAVQFADISGASANYLGDIEYTSDGRVFVTGGFALSNRIYEITGGGTFSTPFATLTNAPNTGGAFGLAINPFSDQILVAPLATNYVIDITSGGTIDASSTSPFRWAYNIPVTNDMAMDFVTPEPSTLAMAGIGLFGLAAYGWRRKHARS